MNKMLLAMLALLICPPTAALADAAADAAACDALAASPEDAQRPPGVMGVASKDMNVIEAISSCETALKSNAANPRIAFQLARALIVADHSRERAFSLNLSAAQAGYIVGMINLANQFGQGKGTKMSASKSFIWTQEAGKRVPKNRVAAFNLGRAYLNGKGTAVDLEKAGSNFCDAAEFGFVDAFISCAWAYNSGNGRQQDGDETIKWYRKSAEAGVAEGQFNLARAYENGSFVPQNLGLAAEWYEKAVAQNYVEAMADLGMIYEAGIARPKDQMKANELYLRAAEAGNTAGQNNYGTILIEGQGIAQNAVAGVEWLNKAIQSGLVDSSINLANYYDKGVYLRADPKQSAAIYLGLLKKNQAYAVKQLVEKSGTDFKPATLDAIQAQLKAEGKVFPASTGKFTPEIIAVLKSYAVN